MKWLKGQVAVLLTVVTLLISVGIAYGRLSSRQEVTEKGQQQLRVELARKVDSDRVIRELDQVHEQLTVITERLDGVIIRQAIIADRDSAAGK